MNWKLFYTYYWIWIIQFLFFCWVVLSGIPISNWERHNHKRHFLFNDIYVVIRSNKTNILYLFRHIIYQGGSNIRAKDKRKDRFYFRPLFKCRECEQFHERCVSKKQIFLVSVVLFHQIAIIKLVVSHSFEFTLTKEIFL